MNNTTQFILRATRKIYRKLLGSRMETKVEFEQDPGRASSIVLDALSSDQPYMIARFGSTELMALINYMGVESKDRDLLGYIRGRKPAWWWEENAIQQMANWSGFFPSNAETLTKFGAMMLEDLKKVDVLGSWLADEKRFIGMMPSVTLVHLRLLEPFWSETPWTMALEGKKVLVIHPFEKEIQEQYTVNRKHLFNDSRILPEFELSTIKAVQSLGGENSEFTSWFEALDWMKAEMDKTDYDIALIGCGAYGFPLAAHAKRSGKKAVHLGGALQLLFGIIGRRWEDPNYGVEEWGIPRGAYSSLINQYWLRPGESEKPKNAQQVEGACYW